MSKPLQSWGRYPHVRQQGQPVQWRDQIGQLMRASDQPRLPFGLGRSYGDSCLSSSGELICTRALDRFIAFDPASGILRCEAGVTLAEILARVIPQGWFLPVTPGTKFVTVGGAIANDVHGKNHHLAGSFGDHLRQFTLARSSGEQLICSRTQNNELFRATIGGLGLTGIILEAELQLKRISNSAVQVENIKYRSLTEFFELSATSARDYEYTVAWVDCLAGGKQLGRGHFMRANHAPAGVPTPAPKRSKLSVPLDPPISLINPLSLRLFNCAYYHRQRRRSKTFTAGYDPFFYPLDSIHQWNRIYGPKGFQQYQCVVPPEHAEPAIGEILQRISRAGRGSFLAVLKVFGDRPAPGLLSFPRPGATLALDFPYHPQKNPQLFAQLDEVVRQAGGAIYPAKDAHINGEDFRRGYPAWQQLEQLRDPALNSLFWQRVNED